MATSTYFGWTEPDDTDLVKNGASAMRTLGNAIDSSLYNAVGKAAGKNAVINGGFDIWQRGTSATTSGWTCADRWYNVVGGTTTFSQDTSVPTAIGVQYSYKWTTSASSSYGQYYTALESATVKPLRGQSMVFSFWVKTTGTAFTGLLNADVAYSNSSDAYASQTVAVAITGATNITPTSTWTRYSGTLTIPSDAVGLKIGVVPTAVQASGVVVYLAGVQLELGSSATPFSRAGGTIQGELAACQRYYFRTNFDAASSYPTFGQGGANSTTQARTLVNFPCNMRTKPTAIDYPTIGTYFTVIDFADAGVTPTSVSLDSNQSDSKTGYLLWNVSSGLTQNRPYFVRGNNSTAAYLGWSAEL